MNEIKNHGIYYVSLLFVFVAGIVLIAQSNGNRMIQMMTVLILTFFYVVFGIVHHIVDHTVSSKIVIEYILMGSLGMAVVLFLYSGGLGA